MNSPLLAEHVGLELYETPKGYKSVLLYVLFDTSITDKNGTNETL